MRVEVERESVLRFGTGSPVRAASAVAPFGDGWLIAQDDATHAAWHRPGGIRPVRVLHPVDGHEVFSAAAGTKQLKPDFEAACDVWVDGVPAVLLLGSGLEGACRHGDRLRWFQRGNAAAGVPSASVDVDRPRCCWRRPDGPGRTPSRSGRPGGTTWAPPAASRSR